MAHAWQARHGLTSAQYQAEFYSLVSQGYRLIDVSGYQADGTDRYAAVWEQSPGPDWEARHGLTSVAHQALFSTFPAQGYRPVRVSGYEAAGEDRYASLWHKIGGSDWRARHGLSPAEYQSEMDTLSAQGFRPIDVCGYTFAGETRFAAIWDKSPISGWVAKHGLTSEEYQAQFDHWIN